MPDSTSSAVRHRGKALAQGANRSHGGPRGRPQPAKWVQRAPAASNQLCARLDARGAAATILQLYAAAGTSSQPQRGVIARAVAIATARAVARAVARAAVATATSATKAAIIVVVISVIVVVGVGIAVAAAATHATAATIAAWLVAVWRESSREIVLGQG